MRMGYDEFWSMMMMVMVAGARQGQLFNQIDQEESNTSQNLSHWFLMQIYSRSSKGFPHLKYKDPQLGPGW